MKRANRSNTYSLNVSEFNYVNAMFGDNIPEVKYRKGSYLLDIYNCGNSKGEFRQSPWGYEVSERLFAEILSLFPRSVCTNHANKKLRDENHVILHLNVIKAERPVIY